MGNTFGGVVMEWMASAALISAERHSSSSVAIVALDDIYFRNPSTVGDRLIVRAKVNRAFQTSMEVGVRVDAVNLKGDLRHINTGRLTSLYTLHYKLYRYDFINSLVSNEISFLCYYKS
jgi:acyl-CoA hydrolase